MTRLSSQYARLIKPWRAARVRNGTGRPRRVYGAGWAALGALVAMFWLFIVLGSEYALYLYWVGLVTAAFAFYVPAVWLYRAARRARTRYE